SSMTAPVIEAPFAIANPWSFPRHGLPLRCSVPLPQGLVRDPAADLALLDEAGKGLGAQWRVISTWPDGTARFALLDYAEAVLPPRTTRKYRLVKRDASHPPGADAAPASPIRVSQDERTLTVDTGRLRWVFSKERFSLGEAIHFNGRDWIGGNETDLVVEDV